MKKEVVGTEELKYEHLKKTTSLLYLLSGIEDGLKCLIGTFSPRASFSAFGAWRPTTSGRRELDIIPLALRIQKSPSELILQNLCPIIT